MEGLDRLSNADRYIIVHIDFENSRREVMCFEIIGKVWKAQNPMLRFDCKNRKGYWKKVISKRSPSKLTIVDWFLSSPCKRYLDIFVIIIYHRFYKQIYIVWLSRQKWFFNLHQSRCKIKINKSKCIKIIYYIRARQRSILGSFYGLQNFNYPYMIFLRLWSCMFYIF